MSTPNALDRLRARLAPGITLTCVENTYIPDRAGTSGVLTKVGKSYADAVKDGAPGFRYSLPTRVRDVEWLDEDTVRYPIPSRPGHTVTYRISDEQATPDELAPGMYRVRITVTNRDGVHTATEDMNPAAIELARTRPGWSVEILGEAQVTIVADEEDTAEEEAPAGKVRLIGIGNVPAVPLSDVRPGDRITWNYGQTYTVVRNTQVAANTYELVERGEDGRGWTRRKRGTKLVARRPGIDQAPAASETTPDETEQLAAERRRVVRHFQPYTSEQRANLAASRRVGHRQRQSVGEHFYTHPDVPGVAFGRRGAAARAGIKASRTARPTTDPRAVTGTPENIDARASARARGERASQTALAFDEGDRQAMTVAQLRATAGGALALF